MCVVKSCNEVKLSEPTVSALLVNFTELVADCVQMSCKLTIVITAGKYRRL